MVTITPTTVFDFPRLSLSNFHTDLNSQAPVVTQWGNTIWKSMGNAFSAATKLDITATDIPDLSHVSSLSSMFILDSNLVNQNVSLANWDTSTITTMRSMFNRASQFNQNIGNWNTSSVTNPREMFVDASLFNQDIGNRDTSQVTDMHGMFNQASAFNQNLSDWSITSLTTASTMLTSTGLSQDNYNTLLEGWARQDTIQSNTDFTGTGLNPSTNLSALAKQQLENDHSWSIN